MNQEEQNEKYQDENFEQWRMQEYERINQTPIKSSKHCLSCPYLYFDEGQCELCNKKETKILQKDIIKYLKFKSKY